MAALYERYDGTPPKGSGREGLENAILAMAFDDAANEEKIVNLEKIWAHIGK